MDELRFVLKCFAFSALFLVLTQIKAGDKTIENHIHSSLVNSKVSDFVNKVADGGVKLIKDSYYYSMDSYQDWKGTGNSKSAEPKDIKTQAIQKLKHEEPDNTQAKTEPSFEEEAGLVEE